MIPLVLLIIFIIIPIAELWLILQVGAWIGAEATIMLLLAGAVLGAWLIKIQGANAWKQFREDSAAGLVPAEPAVDGFLVIFGGGLLVVPGFLSDVAGLLLVAPPTRKLLRTRIISSVSKRTQVKFAAGPRMAGDDLRDFAHSDQPRRTASQQRNDQERAFDFESQQLSE